ncbi:Secreted protein [Frankia sp. AiPs1]|uniref:FxLYD domain-containing protein n=1 Tax=Frankia sp. AiPa1 TaxID=573492 RepID=UPI00202AC335|nr:FxLYD domain-containing protein [Frankia sp. AiPa1]MCL9759175.1 FxLYD domain-containing protein [Frankia sp. AiPa1]
MAGGLVLGLAAGCAGLLAGCSSGGSGVAKDVRITGCARDPDNHRAVVRGTVHNSSSKRSNYVIQVDVQANDSKIESGLASVLRVQPGRTETFTAKPVGVDVPSGTALKCTVAHVGRIAAE